MNCKDLGTMGSDGKAENETMLSLYGLEEDSKAET